METKSAKIRINLSTREFELEGSEDFIKKYQELILEYTEMIKTQSNSSQKKPNSTSKIELEDNSPTETLQHFNFQSFGEFFTKFPKNIKDVDKILIAGYYIQILNETKSFTTREASSALIQQNIKLTNPSASISLNLETRKIFKLSNREFRVSDLGTDYIESLKIDKNH